MQGNRLSGIRTVATIGFGVAAALALAFQARMTVESKDGKRNFKHFDIGAGHVHLIKALSSVPCIRGRSWGYDHNGIWVDHGCRAEFEIIADKSADWKVDPEGRRRIKVESEKDRPAEVHVVTDNWVRLVKQLSDRPCVENRTWGFTKDRVWVSDGCRAVFSVGKPRYRL